MQQALAYQGRLRKRAAQVLTAGQLAVYDQLVAEKMILVRAVVRSTIDAQANVVQVRPLTTG